MTETLEKPAALETTPTGDWIVPNQDKLEQVIDARLKQHSDSEKSERKAPARSASKSSE
jgi:hypothetical protein